jgi:hypoxanthine phosphoribosyltransferase
VEIKDIAQQCIDRWGEDNKTKNLSNKIGKFISQTEDREVGNILLELLQSYNYYSRSAVHNILIDFCNEIENVLCLDKDTTIYSRIEKDSKIASSSTLLEEYKIINEIGSNYSHDISKLHINQFDYISNIVFIDDVIGTGSTIIKFFKKYIDKIKKCTVVLFCIEAMEEGKKAVEQYFIENEIPHIVVVYREANKAFDSNGIYKDKASEEREKLYNFEKNLARGREDYALGLNQSEALISFYRNTPNNTISSYWKPYSNWSPLFERDLNRPLFMQANKGLSKNQKNNVVYNITKVLNNKE